MTEATPGRLRLLALGAFLYSVLRSVDAVGLWRGRRWAEWYGVATGLVYTPLEALAFIRRPGPESLLALIVNLGIVLFLGIQLRAGVATPATTVRTQRNRPNRQSGVPKTLSAWPLIFPG